jgi:glycerol-3-phosphate dehydrogenase subunit C
LSEGSLEAPIRHPLDWENPDFYDMKKIEEELHRVFDICHGCRRCFNLCDSFPTLFDMVDAAPTSELDSVDPKDFKKVVDGCTLCDMCFLTKCPYVPPHEFDLDFPHLMLRYRAAELKQGVVHESVRQLIATDRNGALAGMVAPFANFVSKRGNTLTRPLLESVAGIAQDAELPKYFFKTFAERALDRPPVNTAAPGHGRKAVLYATCYVNFNNPDIGTAARAILAYNGVETVVEYPGCCGMPQLEQGDIADVAEKAKRVASQFRRWIEAGYEIVALIPSCALMLKFEWPLILPDDPDVKFLAEHTSDLSEYLVAIAKKEGLAPGLQPLPGPVTVHIACHARAQNMGQKAAELLRLIPGTKIDVIERCSGHGGSWGVMKENFETALKVGLPVARQAVKNDPAFVASECPLAGIHIVQGMERLQKDKDEDKPLPIQAHPVELFAMAYGWNHSNRISPSAPAFAVDATASA